jgi:ElaB/YqjD/DUF883 family membrane-anchored ribosome-binding protein
MTTTQDYADSAKHQIDQLAAEINKIQDMGKKALADLQKEYEKRIKELSDDYQREMNDLNGKKADIEQRIKKMRSASGNALEELRVGTDAAIAEMKDALRRARREFETR